LTQKLKLAHDFLTLKSTYVYMTEEYNRSYIKKFPGSSKIAIMAVNGCFCFEDKSVYLFIIKKHHTAPGG